MQLVHFCHLDDVQKKSVLELRNHPEVRRWMYTDHRIAWGEHVKFIDSLYRSCSKSHWLVCEGDEILGSVNLSDISTLHGHAHVGIYTNPDCLKKQKGTRLLEVLKQVAFYTLNLHALKLEVLAENRKAIAFYSKNGFETEGILKGYMKKNGQYEDVVIMGCMNE